MMRDPRRWILVVVLFLVVVTLLLWFLKPTGPSPDERRVRNAIRNARSLYLTTSVDTKTFPNDRLFFDAGRLAETFRLKGKRSRNEVSTNVMVYLTESPGTADEIVLLHPPDSVFVERNLYAVDPDFWTELLSQAPKTREWLEDVVPRLLERGIPIERR